MYIRFHLFRCYDTPLTMDTTSCVDIVHKMEKIVGEPMQNQPVKHIINDDDANGKDAYVIEDRFICVVLNWKFKSIDAIDYAHPNAIQAYATPRWELSKQRLNKVAPIWGPVVSSKQDELSIDNILTITTEPVTQKIKELPVYLGYECTSQFSKYTKSYAGILKEFISIASESLQHAQNAKRGYSKLPIQSKETIYEAGVQEVIGYLADYYDTDEFNSEFDDIRDELQRVCNDVCIKPVIEYEWYYDPSDSGSRGGDSELLASFSLYAKYNDGSTTEDYNVENDGTAYYNADSFWRG